MVALKEVFNKHGIELVYVQNKEEALKWAKAIIKPEMSIGLGGSVTVEQIGLLEYLVSLKTITLFNQYEKGISMQENVQRRREGLLSDLYICGTNALTRDGKLINADGSGNRVAAQIFGPKKVLVVAGRNKIVANEEEGIKRIMEIAAPKNIERINNAAKAMGKEPRYTMENIANKWTCINSDEQGRTTILLINEDLGF